MARYQYGGINLDYAFTFYALGASKLMAASAATLTFFDAEVNGSQITDLQDGNGNAITSVSVPDTGDVPKFYGPDGVTSMWVAADGSATRTEMVSVKAAADAVSNAEAASTAAQGHATDAANSASAAATSAQQAAAPTDDMVSSLVQASSNSKTSSALSAAIVRTPGAPSRALGAICFTWDDGFSNWLQVAQMAHDRGQRHTFNITSNHIDTGTDTGISSADIKAIYDMGHEIGCHSKTHPNMSQITSAQRQPEWDDSLAALEAIVGTGNVTTFVYPYGSTYSPAARNNTCDREGWGRYKRLRDTSLGGFTPMEDRYGVFLIPSKSYVQAEVLAAIDRCAAQPVVYCCFDHWPDHVYGGAANVSLADLGTALDKVQSLGVPTMTLSEAFPAGGVITNPHFVNGLGGWRQVGDSGAITTAAVVNPPTGLKNTGNLVRITPTTTAYNAITQLVPVIPGQTLQIGYCARVGANGAGAASFAGVVTCRFATQVDYAGLIAGYDEGTASSGRTKYVMSSQGDFSGAWNVMGAEYVVPAGARFVEVQIGVSGETGVPVEVFHPFVGYKRFGNFG